MENVIIKANDLANEIKTSECYKQYMSSKEIIEKDPDLKIELENYRRLNLEYRLKIMQKNTPSFDEEKKLSNLYSKLMLNEYTRNFLDNEKMLVETLDKVYNIIGKDIQLTMF